MEQSMVDDISTLKINQALLVQKQKTTDKIIADLETSLAKLEDSVSKITKGGYIFLGVYIANTVGAGDAIKTILKVVAGG